MATAAEVAEVRQYTDEPTEAVWTDVELSALVDELGSVEAATSRVWREKVARYSRLVDVSEAGASRKMSQAFSHAKAMAEHWGSVVALSGSGSSNRARVHKIDRS